MQEEKEHACWVDLVSQAAWLLSGGAVALGCATQEQAPSNVTDRLMNGAGRLQESRQCGQINLPSTRRWFIIVMTKSGHLQC